MDRFDPSLEAAAKIIYGLLPYDGPEGTEKPAWSEHGNSLKQDLARMWAKDVIAALPRASGGLERADLEPIKVLARTWRKSKQLTGPQEYHHQPAKMKVWVKTRYQCGKELWEALRALPNNSGEVDVDALAIRIANIRQGESDTPRCEPPGQYEVDIAREWAVRVLKALPGTKP